MDNQELTKRLIGLKKLMAEDKLHIAPHLMAGFNESLDRIRYDNDGLVIPGSVDGSLRAMFNAFSHFEEREEWKGAISLKLIQQRYFEIVRYFFGDAYNAMIKAGADPSSFSHFFSQKRERYVDILERVDGLFETISKFWADILEAAWIHLEDSAWVKAVYSGVVFPDGSNNIASSSGLLFDTTVLPCPFFKMSQFFSMVPEAERFRESFRLALQVLAYEPLAVGDFDTPVVAILPDRFYQNTSYRDYVFNCAEKDTIAHVGKIFGKQFFDSEEMRGYLNRFTSSTDLVASLVHPEELLFATDWDESLAEQINRFKFENAEKMGFRSIGDAVYMNIFGRFSQANDSFLRSRDLRGTPIIGATASWKWFNWMLRINSGDADLTPLGIRDLHISRAIESSKQSDLSWLGNVPPSAMLDIRKTGAIDEIRGILRSGIQEIVDANPNNFTETSNRVIRNLQIAFTEHEEKLKKLRNKKWRFAGKDIGSFFVVGGIEIAAALTGRPAYGVITAFAGMTGAIPTLKDIREKFTSFKDESKKLSGTGIGMLFNFKD